MSAPGFLVDHEPPVRIETALARAGIVFEKDKQLDLLNTRTGEINLAHAPDEIMVTAQIFDPVARRRSYEILSEIHPPNGL